MLQRLLTVLCLLLVAADCGSDKKSTGGDQPGFWAPYIGSYDQVYKSKSCGVSMWTTTTNSGVICQDGPAFTVEAPGFTQDTMIIFEGKTTSGQDSVDVVIRGTVRQGIMCLGELEFRTWMKPSVSSPWTQYVKVVLEYPTPACEQYGFCFDFELERSRTGDAPDPCTLSAKQNALPDEVWQLITTSQ